MAKRFKLRQAPSLAIKAGDEYQVYAGVDQITKALAQVKA